MKWKERIALAKKERAFTIQDKYDSGQWAICAVGERKLNGDGCNSGTNGAGHERSGTKAHRLGHQFNDAVRLNNITKAKAIYDQIQKLK